MLPTSMSETYDHPSNNQLLVDSSNKKGMQALRPHPFFKTVLKPFKNCSKTNYNYANKNTFSAHFSPIPTIFIICITSTPQKQQSPINRGFAVFFRANFFVFIYANIVTTPQRFKPFEVIPSDGASVHACACN